MDKKEVILIGGFHEVIELCEHAGYKIIGIIDNNLIGNFLGHPIIGNDSDALLLFEKYREVPLVIAPDSPFIREKLVNLYSSLGYKFETIISPNATISKFAQVGNGTIIQSGVNVSSFSIICDFVKLNTNCNIMHDSVVGELSTIAPNAVILGRIDIGKRSYIGANSTILPEIIIGENATIGAGAVVTKNVNANSIVKGVPAK